MSVAPAFIVSRVLWVIPVLVGSLSVFGGRIALRAWKNSRPTPQERERLRRSALIAHGKMGDANMVEVRDDHLFYSYDVRGVRYTASQDVSDLRDYLPQHLPPALGPVYIFVKYDPKNPANSVILSERWSGFQVPYSQR
jgi:hypothetical protein